MKKLILLLLAIGFSCYFYFEEVQQRLVSWYLDFPQPKHKVRHIGEIMVKSPDGTRLSTDIYLPEAEGKFPVIIARTPYGKRSSRHRYPLLARMFAAQGYAFIVQDVRGKGKSDGEFVPYAFEAADGNAIVEWAGRQEWSNGKVALYGFSYLGSCAWLGATGNSPYLKTLVPLFTSQDTYKGWYDRGVPYLKDMLFWISRYQERENQPLSHDAVDAVLAKYPAEEFDYALNGRYLRTYQQYIHHPQPGPFWSALSADQKLDRLNVPVLIYGGWYDRFIGTTIEDFNRTRNTAKMPVRLVIGPWLHDPTDSYRDIAFPKNGHFFPQFSMMLRWFDTWLKEDADSGEWDAPVTYFVMGKNIWQEADRWPPREASDNIFHLTPRLTDYEMAHQGSLQPAPIAQNKVYHYTADPNNPVPAIGSHMVYGNGLEGPRNQAPLIDREDVLAFVTPKLAKETILAGSGKAVLHVSSDATDTDFAVKLADVYPDGKAVYVQTGYLRMRYRSSLDNPSTIKPGEIYRIEIPFPPTCYAFQEGHRIQLLVTSSDYPNHSKNLNTTKLPEESTTPRIAQQTLFIGGDYDAQLILPLMRD